jgi:hypothetical protein
VFAQLAWGLDRGCGWIDEGQVGILGHDAPNVLRHFFRQKIFKPNVYSILAQVRRLRGRKMSTMGGEGHFAQPFFASPLAPGRAGRLRFFRPVAAQWTR